MTLMVAPVNQFSQNILTKKHPTALTPDVILTHPLVLSLWNKINTYPERRQSLFPSNSRFGCKYTCS